MADDAVGRLVAELKRSRKYRHLCDDILAWAAKTALERQSAEKAALKFAKRKLHQAFGSFVGDRRRLLDALDSAATAESSVGFEAALVDAISSHASTAERSEDPGAFWSALRNEVGPVERVLDLGCGIGPATLPWSGLDGSVTYLGVDLDAELTQALDTALRPRFPNVRVQTADVRADREWPVVDVAILAKLVPTLERQEPGSARRLVERLDATVIVATFPIRSLGGRERGMTANYQALADSILGPGTTRELPGELVRFVRRAAC